MSVERVSVLLVGINGYAKGYLDKMLDKAGEHGAFIAGIADPTANRSERYDEILARNIPVYASMDEFYSAHKADLAIISTPIQLHSLQLQIALKNNSHVLCEKPLCATVDEIGQMLEAKKKSDRFVAIGFNWSFSSTIQEIKNDILSGMYGKPKWMKSLVFWPRYRSYYQRNNWAGKLKNANGDWILDSPLSNATSHFLHNMLYLCGEDITSAAVAGEVCAELYRANQIDNFDTACIRVKTTSGVEICYYTSHATSVSMDPISCYGFENGTISHTGYFTEFTGKLNDGMVKRYKQDPYINTHENKLWQCIENCRSGGEPFCTLETATALTRVVNAAQLSMPTIKVFPAEMVAEKELPADDQLTWVNGLFEAMLYSYDRFLLPSESGLFNWAVPGKVVNASELEHFSL